MKQLLNAYRFVSLLSIDVAVGAAVGAALFARILGVSLYLQAYIVLALTVWIIYTVDHLLDASKLLAPASTRRHQLHQRYFSVLRVMVAVAALVAFVLVLFIRAQLMIPGMIMALFCAVYLLLNQWLKFGKELMATILYAGGVLLPALSLNHNPTREQTLLIAQFVLLVLINMLLFAIMGYKEDVTDRQQSFVTSAGVRAGRVVIAVLLAMFGIICVVAFSEYYVQEKLVLLAMAIILLMIFLFPRFFESEERYRLVGDSIFLLPILVLAFW
jgi:hypothetical protein